MNRLMTHNCPECHCFPSAGWHSSVRPLQRLSSWAVDCPFSRLARQCPIKGVKVLHCVTRVSVKQHSVTRKSHRHKCIRASPQSSIWSWKSLSSLRLQRSCYWIIREPVSCRHLWLDDSFCGRRKLVCVPQSALWGGRIVAVTATRLDKLSKNWQLTVSVL